MQLKKANGFGQKLALATCSLLGVASMAVADVKEATVLDNPQRDNQQETTSEEMNKESWFNFQGVKNVFKGWKFETAFLYYTESERVTAIEPVISAKRAFDTDKTLSLKFVLDILTGASHNGATPATSSQTFTRPSGSGTYTAAPGETPLDDTFHDTRYAASVQWEQELAPNWRGSVGTNFSKEYDFTSFGLNGAVSRDFNEKNTTVSLGLSYEGDQISPEGGIPTPFASMGSPGATQPRQGDSDDRQVIDGLIGVTQVIDQRTLMQVNYSLSLSDGYMTDPFKLLSVVDGNAGSNLGNTTDYLFEKRPDERVRQALYTMAKRKLMNSDILDVSYRFYWDDWGINSHTIDMHYRWFFSEGKKYLEPHLRLYTQARADFYRHSLLSTETTPEFASADYRLGDMDALTVGLKYGHKLENGSSYSVRVEYYLQTGQSPDDGVGSQVGLDLYPSVHAVMTQLIYSM